MADDIIDQEVDEIMELDPGLDRAKIREEVLQLRTGLVDPNPLVLDEPLPRPVDLRWNDRADLGRWRRSPAQSPTGEPGVSDPGWQEVKVACSPTLSSTSLPPTRRPSPDGPRPRPDRLWYS